MSHLDPYRLLGLTSDATDDEVDMRHEKIQGVTEATLYRDCKVETQERAAAWRRDSQQAFAEIKALRDHDTETAIRPGIPRAEMTTPIPRVGWLEAAGIVLLGRIVVPVVVLLLIGVFAKSCNS